MRRSRSRKPTCETVPLEWAIEGLRRVQKNAMRRRNLATRVMGKTVEVEPQLVAMFMAGLRLRK